MGPVRTASKPRSALDEEVGPSDRDLLNLTDYKSPVPWYWYGVS